MDYKKSQKIPNKFSCKKCDYYTNNKKDYNKHLQTNKHNMTTFDRPKYFCECGNTYKNRQNLYRHKKTCIKENNEEHNYKIDKMANSGKYLANSVNFEKNVHFEKNQNSECGKSYICECGKSYKHNSSLSKHKKKCQIYKENQTLTLYKENVDLKDMVNKLIDQNKEILAQNTEIARKPTTINNTQFNVMNYLNTECKDAMNLSDFIESFEFSLKDLEMLNNKGYQEAMEHTFVKQLCDMEKTRRPIHCSDKKRKSFYIKDNDVWEKDKNNEKLIKGMQCLSFVHNSTLNKWKDKNHNWSDNERKQVFYCNSIIEFAKCDKEKERNKVLSKLVNLSIK